MMADSISVMIYWNGNIVKTAEGIEFESAGPRVFPVKFDVNIGQLKRIIMRKIKLRPNEQIFRLFNRYPLKSNQIGRRLRYICQTIIDDDDIQAMIEAFKRHKCDVIELYVEVETRDVDDNVDDEDAEGGFNLGVGDDNPSWPINSQQLAAWPVGTNQSWHINTNRSATLAPERIDVMEEVVAENVGGAAGEVYSDFSDEHEGEDPTFDHEPRSETQEGIHSDDDDDVLETAINDVTIRPPQNKAVPDPAWRRKENGRPVSTRIPNEMDWTNSQMRGSQSRVSQTRYTCSRCRQEGHNARSCTVVGSSRGSRLRSQSGGSR